MRAHEFTEDVDDYSMCVCGIPALTHDLVYEQPIRFVPTARCDKPAASLNVVVDGYRWRWVGREWVAA